MESSLRVKSLWTVLLVLLQLWLVLAVGYSISDVRLQDGPDSRTGVAAVETAPGIWKPLCFDESVGTADIICQHLGFGGVPKEDLQPNIDFTKAASLICDGNNSLVDNCRAHVVFPTCDQFLYVACDSEVAPPTDPLDPCATKPCRNGGTCNTVTSGFLCTCLSNYVGDICDEEQMSCVGRCGHSSNHLSCGCDSMCMTFGDCCLDVSKECAGVLDSHMAHATEIERARLGDFKRCETIFSQKPLTASKISEPTKFQMVASCPGTWRDETVSRKCMMALSNDTTDLSLLLPVHNNAGTLFKNTYCALCHKTFLDEMLLWHLVETDSNIHVSPPRTIWGSKFEACNENLIFTKSCPEGTNGNVVYNCERFVDIDRFSVAEGSKNAYCSKCNNLSQTVTEITLFSPVTFDVVFGLQSWSSLRSTCRKNGHVMEVEKLFQNACPLLDELMDTIKGTEGSVESTDREQCVRQFLSKIYPSDIFHVFPPVTSPDDEEDASVRVLLPNALTALHLESVIEQKVVAPRCSVDLSVSLLVKNTSSCHYQAGGNLSYSFVDSSYQSFNHIFTIQCYDSCRVIEQNKVVCSDIICQWEDEFLPMINFHVNNFVPIEIRHEHSGAVLKEEHFTFTGSKEIHTCSEHLIGSWVHASFYIQIICGPLSLLCIILMIVIHIIFQKLRNIYGFCIVSLLSMLFVALFFFMLISLLQMVDGLAQVVVAIDHYAWLSAFAWMTVISFHVSHTFGGKIVANRMSKISSRKEPLLYGVFGWGVPLPFLVIGVVLHLCDCTSFYYSRHWMSPGHLTALLFVVPAILLAVITAVLFTIGLTKLRRKQKPPDPESSKQMSTLHNYLVALRLFFIVGIPWVLFTIYVATRNRYLLPILTLVNSLQGCFIFLSFVTTRRVRALLKEASENYWSSTGRKRYCKGKSGVQTETGTLDNLTPRMNRMKPSSSGTPPTDRK